MGSLFNITRGISAGASGGIGNIVGDVLNILPSLLLNSRTKFVISLPNNWGTSRGNNAS